jgi:hypothetical protein
VKNKQASHMTMGLVVVAVGLIMLAGQLDWNWNFGRLWPVIFLVIGLGKFLSSDEDSVPSGITFLFLGGIFLMHTFRIFTLGHSWPLFIVMGGLSMIIGRGRCKPKGGQVQS